MFNRRVFLNGCIATLAASRFSFAREQRTTEIAITMDDPKPDELAGVPGSEINRRILKNLAEERITAALFVTGMRIDNPAGSALIGDWDAAGHRICNHTYSHRNYCAPEMPYQSFVADFLKNEPVIRKYKNFTRLFRYPFLKEGETAEKRDGFRTFLRQHGYRVGHVTVDASDWYIDARMRERLKKEPKADTTPYRDYYIAHMRDRASFYLQLARDVLGHDIRHTVLIHHNLLNALYLGDMMRALREDGWKWIDAPQAFADPVFQREAKTLPAGESLVWALAKGKGGFEGRLRYPGEDDVYEKPKMDALGL